jgi:hypothetical protein
VRSSSIVLVLVLVLAIDSWLPAPRKIEDDDEDDYEHDKDESRQAPQLGAILPARLGFDRARDPRYNCSALRPFLKTGYGP